MYDLIVVGGGPVGSEVSQKLAGMRYKVAVLERKECLDKPVCCTGIISQECVNSFAVDEDVILRQVNGGKLFSPSGNSIRLWRKDIIGGIINRPAFNFAMACKARNAGAEFVLHSRVSDIDVMEDRISIKAVCQGKNMAFEARAVVIASGFSSQLTDRLGLEKIDHFVVGAQAEVESVGVDETEIYFGQKIAPQFFAWLVPTLPGRALVGLASRYKPWFYLRKLLASLMSQGKVVSDKVELRYRVIPLKTLSRTYGDRLVVVGDAAGQVKPTTGGGIYYGLICADIAANALNHALESDDLSARSLASYERGWKKKLGQELRICNYARKFYDGLNDPQIERLFNLIKAAGIDQALLKQNDLSFDWHGKTILRLLGNGSMAGALRMIKNSFL